MKAVVPTFTEYSASNDLITIITYYQEGVLPDTILGVISDVDKVSNNVSVTQGDLYIKYKGVGITYDINTLGELILNSNDSDNYSLNEDGELIYTFN